MLTGRIFGRLWKIIALIIIKMVIVDFYNDNIIIIMEFLKNLTKALSPA